MIKLYAVECSDNMAFRFRCGMRKSVAEQIAFWLSHYEKVEYFTTEEEI